MVSVRDFEIVEASHEPRRAELPLGRRRGDQSGGASATRLR